ncbi:MAG TPA: hypothetical protein ENH32_03335 [Proteobacteria bacterium]|nr:hypothetical protein [Pseudomonadota bacterium]
MGRPLRILQTEFPYHLTCRTNNRTFRFHQRQFTKLFFRAVVQSTKKYNLLVHHIVLMNNHYHIIATATEKNLHRAMQYINSRVAVRYNKLTGRSGHLWGDRYKSCIVSTDEYYTACVRYIYRNPIEAGMVDDLKDYPDSSLQFLAFGRKVEVILTPDHLVIRFKRNNHKLREYFRLLVLDEQTPIPDTMVQKELRGLFFGPADFIQQMQRTHLGM